MSEAGRKVVLGTGNTLTRDEGAPGSPPGVPASVVVLCRPEVLGAR